MHKAGSTPPDALTFMGPLTDPVFVRRAACARDGEADPTLGPADGGRLGRWWLALWFQYRGHPRSPTPTRVAATVPENPRPAASERGADASTDPATGA